MVVNQSKLIGASLFLIVAYLPAAYGQPAENPAFFDVWSSSMTTPADDRWFAEDHACTLGCVDVSFPYLIALLDDPANDERSMDELIMEAWQMGGNHLASTLTEEGAANRARLAENEDAAAIACERNGLFRTIMSPLPFVWTRHDDTIEMVYEEWEVTRTVFMDGRNHPADIEPSLYGHSVGRFDGGDLVIESVGILPADFYPHLGGGGHSDQASIVERYTQSENGERLDMTVTITDPIMLTEPLVFVKAILKTPQVEILEHSCEAISGER